MAAAVADRECDSLTVAVGYTWHMPDDVERHSAGVHRRDLARLIRFVIALGVVAVIVLLALDNRDDTRVGYLWDDASFPLWLVIVGSAIGGALVGWLLRLSSRRHAT